MALTRTALGTSAGKDAAMQILFGAGVSAGDLIVVVSCGDVAPPTPDFRYNGSTSQLLAQDVIATNSGNVVTAIFSGIALHPTDASGRINQATSSGAIATVAIKISGNSLAPFDRSSAGTGTGTSPSSGATATLATADEICIGAVGTEGPLSDAAGTWSNSFNAGQRDGTGTGGAASNVTISEGYLVVSATTAQTAAKTSITSRDWAACIATYKGFMAKPNEYLIKQAIKRAAYY